MSENTELRRELKLRGACGEALEWLGHKRTRQQMWDECERADWLLWYAANHLTRQELVALACVCARTALRFVPEGEERPLRAIEAAERWTRGEATLDEVRAAAKAANAAAAYAAAVAYDAAAYAAAVANAAAYAADAAYAAAYAADAAYAAAYAAYAADAAHRDLCRMIRERYLVVPFSGQGGAR